MSTKMLYRLSGLALLIGSSLAFLFEIIRRAVLNSSDVLTVTTVTGLPWLIIHLVIMLGAIGIVVGLPAVYARLLMKTGWLGLVGFALVLCAVLLLGVADMALWAFAIPLIATHAPQLLPGLAPPPALLVFYSAANLAFCIGAVLLGIAALRAQTLPPEVSGVGAALIGAGILDAVNSVPLPDALWGLSQITSASSAFFLLISLVGFGVALMGRQQATVVQPIPAVIDASSKTNG